MSRLQYFARVSQAYQKRLREALANKKGEELKTDENKIKLIALKTTANINALIRDLFHQPPSYKVCYIVVGTVICFNNIFTAIDLSTAFFILFLIHVVCECIVRAERLGIHSRLPAISVEGVLCFLVTLAELSFLCDPAQGDSFVIL